MTRMIALVCAVVFLTGCVTSMTIERAKGDKEVVGGHGEPGPKAQKPAPALYALMPLTVAADIVLYPLWCLWSWGRMAVGLSPD